jgi:hypothetical protein
MLQTGAQVRFTPREIADARRLGIDLAGARTMADYSDAVIRLIKTLEAERPDLLEKIARAMCERSGRSMPARLGLVR